MTDSVSFDRAADYYDATRSLPEDQMAVLVSRLLRELRAGTRCLEIGVGTGRIALPLMRAGVRMVGVDISRDMLRKLRDKEPAIPVAIADATRLPFPDRSFDSAIASHVLHLITDWRTAVGELMRVVVPGGVLLASRGARSRTGWQQAVRRRFYVEAGDPRWPPGIDRIEQLDEEMRARGAATAEIEDVTSEGLTSISNVLASLEKGIFSACWLLDEDTRLRAAAATRRWAAAEFGDLEAPRPVSHHSDWRAYRLPE